MGELPQIFNYTTGQTQHIGQGRAGWCQPPSFWGGTPAAIGSSRLCLAPTPALGLLPPVFPSAMWGQDS